MDAASLGRSGSLRRGALGQLASTAMIEPFGIRRLAAFGPRFVLGRGGWAEHHDGAPFVANVHCSLGIVGTLHIFMFPNNFFGRINCSEGYPFSGFICIRTILHAASGRRLALLIHIRVSPPLMLYAGLSPMPVPASRRPRDKWRAPADLESSPVSPENYRYYCLDRSGRLHDAEWLDASSDQEAVAQVQVRYPEARCEIWQGHRLVAALSPVRLQA